MLYIISNLINSFVSIIKIIAIIMKFLIFPTDKPFIWFNRIIYFVNYHINLTNDLLIQ